MARCKHKNLGHIEVIEAYHQTDFENGKHMFNNEYGDKIKDIVRCYDCQKEWIVVKSSPKFILTFHKMVQSIRDTEV